VVTDQQFTFETCTHRLRIGHDLFPKFVG
jgi:hypothetical protein